MVCLNSKRNLIEKNKVNWNILVTLGIQIKRDSFFSWREEEREV